MSAEWKPIETAPRDRQVLVHIPGIGPDIAQYYSEQYKTKPRPFWMSTRGSWMGRIWMRANQPTHWMELPEAKP